MRTVSSTIAIVAAGLFASAAAAQDLGHKAPAQQRPVLIMNATIHTVANGVIEDGGVLFSEGRIESIMAGEALANWRRANRTADIEFIDAKGKHVYPGLIGASSTMGLAEISAVSVTMDTSETGVFTPEVRANVAVNPDSTHIPVARAAGVLINGVMPGGGTITGRASVIQLDGWTWEDMTIVEDAGLVISWPSMRPVRSAWVTMSEEEQLERSNRMLRALDDMFVRAEAYVAARDADPTLPVDVRLEAMRPAMEGRTRVFINANELEQIQSAVSWATGRNLKAVIVGGRDAPKCLDLLKRHSIPVIVGGTHRLPSRRDAAYDEPFTVARSLHEAGVPWCMASGGGSTNERNLAHQAATAVAFGLPVEEGVRSVTLSPAEILGIDDRYGSIESGKSATLIVTDGNPLDIRTTVEMAFIDGRRIDLRNKQTDLRDKYREKYRQLGLIE
jgi:imidazolonepropionase-like amidohydrolase